MTAEYIIILLVALVAVAYLVYRAKQELSAFNDPCRGCSGCALKGKIPKNKIRQLSKKQCERAKNGK